MALVPQLQAHRYLIYAHSNGSWNSWKKRSALQVFQWRRADNALQNKREKRNKQKEEVESLYTYRAHPSGETLLFSSAQQSTIELSEQLNNASLRSSRHKDYWKSSASRCRSGSQGRDSPPAEPTPNTSIRNLDPLTSTLQSVHKSTIPPTIFEPQLFLYSTDAIVHFIYLFV